MFLPISANNIKKWEEKKKLSPIIKALDSKEVEIRKEAERALIRLGKPVVEPLIKACNKFHSDHAPRVIAKIYRKKKDDDIFNLMMENLNPKKDKKGWVKMAAIKALGLMKDKRAEEPLIDLIIHEYGGVDSDVVTALGNIKSEKAIIPLIYNLVDRGYIVDRVIDALVKIGKPTVDHLLETMKENEPKYSEAATKALKKLKRKKNCMSEQQIELFENYINNNKVDIQRGGLNEPYCSYKCLKNAAVHINMILTKKPLASCGICSKKLKKSGYDNSSFGFIPFEGKTLFICSECAQPVEGMFGPKSRIDFLKKHKECCMCRRSLKS